MRSKDHIWSWIKNGSVLCLFLRMYFWWSLCTLYLLACQVRPERFWVLEHSRLACTNSNQHSFFLNVTPSVSGNDGIMFSLKHSVNTNCPDYYHHHSSNWWLLSPQPSPPASLPPLLPILIKITLQITHSHKKWTLKTWEMHYCHIQQWVNLWVSAEEH